MHLDVLVITALFDELSEVLALTDDNSAEWEEDTDPDGFRFHRRKFTTDSGEPLAVAAAWSGTMGEVAAADRSRALVMYLQPLCVAMSGICAGRRGDVFLGDVIVANRVFSYDHGKLIAATSDKGNRDEQLFHDIETYNLEKTWAMDAAYFASKNTWCQHLLSDRPLSLDIQRLWVLRTLLKHETEDSLEPVSHPERDISCPSWSDVVESLINARTITVKNGTMKLSKKGREFIMKDRLLYPDGPPQDPPFQVHVGPIGTGKTVRNDPDIFPRLKKLERNVLGLEMEAVAIGYVAEHVGIPSIVVKAVTDYADEEKDDSFRTFASRASIEFLIAFLKKHPPSSLRKTRPLLSHNATEALSKGVAAEVVKLLKEGVTLSPSQVNDLNQSLFYCSTKSGGRSIGVALNNSGLIAYAATRGKLTHAQSLSNGVQCNVTRHIPGNSLIAFAVLDCSTRGLPASYWDQGDIESIEAFAKFHWVTFDVDGKLKKLTLDSVDYVTVIEGITLDNVITAVSEEDDEVRDIIASPVLTESNELVGLAIAYSSEFVIIWPWASLESVLTGANIYNQR